MAEEEKKQEAESGKDAGKADVNAASEEKPAEPANEEAKAEPAKEAAKPEPAASAPKKVNYVYGALLLHSAGKPVDEAGLKKVVEAAGEQPDIAQVKALVSSLDGVDIDGAIKNAAVPMAAAAPAAGSESAADAKPKEKPEDAEKKAEEAAAGLSSLFG